MIITRTSLRPQCSFLHSAKAFELLIGVNVNDFTNRRQLYYLKKKLDTF